VARFVRSFRDASPRPAPALFHPFQLRPKIGYRALRPRSNCRRVRVGSSLAPATARFRRERRAVTRYYMHLRESHRDAPRRRRLSFLPPRLSLSARSSFSLRSCVLHTYTRDTPLTIVYKIVPPFSFKARTDIALRHVT